MNNDARRRQAGLQAALLRALVHRDPAPPGLDPDRLRASATSLASKRARSVARAWPGLADGLGARFTTEFPAFAAGTTIPPRGGPLADGYAFAQWLASREALSEQGRLEQITVDLRFRHDPDGLSPRRGPAVRLAWLPSSRRLIIAAGWSRLGPYFLSFPVHLPRRASSHEPPTPG